MSGPSAASRADIENTGNSSRYLPKFLILVVIVIFFMVGEYAWYTDEFQNATIISPNANHDIQSAQSSEVELRKIEISDMSSNNSVYNTKSDNSKPCREATVKGKYYLRYPYFGYAIFIDISVR